MCQLTGRFDENLPEDERKSFNLFPGQDRSLWQPLLQLKHQTDAGAIPGLPAHRNRNAQQLLQQIGGPLVANVAHHGTIGSHPGRFFQGQLEDLDIAVSRLNGDDAGVEKMDHGGWV